MKLINKDQMGPAEETAPSAPNQSTEKQGECPLCHKETMAAFRPFCSKKCKMVDLYKWVAGHYVIPGDPAHVLEQEEQEAKEEWAKAWKDKDF
ncbi:MAG: DNA gyrase inhibitor YacG [Alphaproteobacteria bacterium]